MRIRASAVLALACLGCSGPPSNPGPPFDRELVVVMGRNQSARPGAPLVEPIVLELRDVSGAPVANAQLQFHVTRGGGRLLNVAGRTDQRGQASVVWLLGAGQEAQQLQLQRVFALYL